MKFRNNRNILIGTLRNELINVKFDEHIYQNETVPFVYLLMVDVQI